MAQVVLVGVGQKTYRFGSWEEFLPPVEAMREVAGLASADAGLARLAALADSIHVVNVLGWSLRDAPTALAEAVGATPSLKEYTAVGGNAPQWLVNRAADNLASGRSRIVLLAGCEMMSSVRRAAKEGHDLGAFRESVSVPLVGVQKKGTLDVEMAHEADLPVRIYPLLENALRAKEGMSIAEQREWLGTFGANCSEAAAVNAHAWHRTVRTAEDVVTVTPSNRMLGFPYTRCLNSEMYVDQAAAVLMMTTETAKELGIDPSRWVYLHGGQDAQDLWFVSERPDLASSPAIEACVRDALDQGSVGLEEVDFFDLYSCFPVVPRLTQRVLGIALDDPRPITLTGGLPFFGGAGNNYVMHSIAEAVLRCRAARDSFGLVTSNGYYATKHGVGLYSGREPKGEWKRTPPDAFQATVALPAPLVVDPTPNGRFVVDAYTVWHGRGGDPEYSILCGRTSDGLRAWGRTNPADKGVLASMMEEEWVGREGMFVGREGSVNVVEFS